MKANMICIILMLVFVLFGHLLSGLDAKTDFENDDILHPIIICLYVIGIALGVIGVVIALANKFPIL